jgi:Cu2+-exporting ATPase
MVPAVAHQVGADGVVHDVPVDALAVGDRVLVRPGEQVPVDATVAEGASTVNEAFLTGESRPVDKSTDSEIIAGSVNGEGALIATVVRTGGDTTLRQIMRLVADAQSSRSRFQALADRAARMLTIVAIGVAAPTLLTWLVWSDRGGDFAFARAVTVLVIACPHALGLAIPLVTTNATTLSARNGILVRNREAFERGRTIHVVAFDKTGTHRRPLRGWSHHHRRNPGGRRPGDRRRPGAVLEHPSRPRLSALPPNADHSLPRRVRSAVPARDHRERPAAPIGSANRSGPSRTRWPFRGSADSLDAAGNAGQCGVAFDEQRALAVFSLRDRIRPSARRAVSRLRDHGIESVMITGDAAAVAASVAAELGITRYHARVLPADKARLVASLGEGGPVAFVGDGINDGPALLAADLGIAIGAGTNVAIESADLVLVDDDPEDAVRALILARATGRKMTQNLLWATGYNVVAIPLAAGVAAGAGILLEPAVGALLMSTSTVIVALNAILLRRTDMS